MKEYEKYQNCNCNEIGQVLLLQPSKMEQLRNPPLPQIRTVQEAGSSQRLEEASSRLFNVLFREIHKNAWLKRLPSVERKTGAFSKRGDRVWVVFCVHDDTEPFLELYSDQKIAVTHKPDWFVSLSNCLHVSPTICAQEEEYEFAITLSSDVVRLAASSWDLMMEWVESIRTKLQEMRILSPRENLYSKMPETRTPLAPTRDPNSPLPPPPMGRISALVPGVEPVQNDVTSVPVSSVGGNSSSSTAPQSSSESPLNGNSIDATTSSSTTDISSESPVYTRANSAPTMLGSRDNNITVIEVNTSSTAPLEYQGVFSFSFIENALPSLQNIATSLNSIESTEILETADTFYTPPQTPLRNTNTQQSEEPSSSVNGVAQADTAQLANSHYERVFLPNVTQIPVASRSPHASDPQISERRRRRSTSTSEISQSESDRSRAVVGAVLPNAHRIEMDRRLQPAPHPYRQIQQAGTETVSSGRFTLREQQVFQLRREMQHPGGVRLQLRRKDCTGSIALVDAFGAVWVTGWKQREHPMLYNALHIGDQLLSVGGIVVQSAADAQKLIRGASSLYVEFILRRVPFGRVYAIRREAEGQSLGLVQEGNTAEIREVVSGGLAALHGLPPLAKTCDGLSLTNWVLTEINGRPLNLFFKDGEVKDRLNAVGKEISILVQPSDLVKQLKKQLKSLRSYKEYIVQ